MGIVNKEKLTKSITQAKLEAREIIRVSELALKKHISLIKNRKHISSIMATLEELKRDVRGDDPEVIYEHVEKLNQLTQGFAGHALKASLRRIKK